MPNYLTRIIGAIMKRFLPSYDIEIPFYMEEHENFKGISIGACIATGKWPKGKRIKNEYGEYLRYKKNDRFVRESEHAAHAHMGGRYKGYICFRTLENFRKETTCKHELAHVITAEGHTKVWAEKYVELKVPAWLTVDWLRNKYGFDEFGGEGTKVEDEWRKQMGITDTNEIE